jgi:hypothetical protein
VQARSRSQVRACLHVAPDARRRTTRLRSVDVARFLGVTHQRVTQMVAEGKLPAVQLDSLEPSLTAAAIEWWAERQWWGTSPWRSRQRGQGSD